MPDRFLICEEVWRMRMSDHYAVLCKIVLIGRWRLRKEMRKEVGRIKSKELNEKE